MNGIIGKLVGGSAQIDGEYRRLAEDTLKDYPESHKLYVWQTLIYTVCINPNSGLNINELAVMMLQGPPALSKSPKGSVDDILIKLEGLDQKTPLSDFPSLVFSVRNDSNETIEVFGNVSTCELTNFLFSKRDRTSPIKGSATMLSVGLSSTRIEPGHTRFIAYEINYLAPLSYEAKNRDYSQCIFGFGFESEINAYDKIFRIDSGYKQYM